MNISLIICYSTINMFDVFQTDKKGFLEVDLVFSGDVFRKSPQKSKSVLLDFLANALNLEKNKCIKRVCQ